jgi:hypothetical protein
MYLMYVDESGDSGLVGSPNPYFVLSGLVIHESQWRACVTQLIAFRKTMKAVYGLPQRVEIHASDYIRRPPVPGIAKHVRLAILRNMLDELSNMKFISITNVVVNKAGKPPSYDVFNSAWQALFQRFENTLRFGNFPGRYRQDHGMVFTDATNGKKLQQLVRKMSVYNPIPHQQWAGPGARNIPILKIIEDPNERNSKESYFIQACDVIAYFVLQHFNASSYIRRSGARNYIRRLTPVLNLRASNTNPLGIVVL